MIDFDRVIDSSGTMATPARSLDKHGVGQAEAEQVFFNEPLLVADDVMHSQSERRFHALGRTESGRCCM